MQRSRTSRLERTLSAATRYLEELREDTIRAAREGASLPPRLRSIHERPGHATPEYRTLAIPIPEEAGGSSPELLSGVIARYARGRSPDALLLAIDLSMGGDGGRATSALVVEARDVGGHRLFWMQRYALRDGTVEWEQPAGGGWQDPGEEEMILDAAFGAPAVEAPRSRRRPPASEPGLPTVTVTPTTEAPVSLQTPAP